MIAKTASESFAAVSGDALLATLITIAETSLDTASDDEYDSWDDVLLFLDEERQRSEIFKQPEVLGYLDSLQQHLRENDIVGKSNSVVDVVKTVHRELLLGKDEAFRIPDTTNAVAQTLVTYQNSHRPQDLWHFVTPDYRKAVLWLQLTSGDNRDMETVINDVETFVIDNPPPFGLEPHWFWVNLYQHRVARQNGVRHAGSIHGQFLDRAVDDGVPVSFTAVGIVIHDSVNGNRRYDLRHYRDHR